ncbi:MAG: hypothetical protein H5T60_04475 [Anaerolineae bacterium]|nr:hypothetical protein [Anaerolineae bacterium]
MSDTRVNGLERAGVLVGLALLVCGYWGPWVSHKAAGLVLLGYDLAEYVKFLGEFRAGILAVWRGWFLLPAGAIALALALCAIHPALRLRWYGGLVGLAAGVLTSLTLLPPAWYPALLWMPEFRLATVIMLAGLAALVLVPIWWLLPWRWCILLAAGVNSLAAAGAVWSFLRVKPAIDRVYGAPAPWGWGWVVMAAGALLLDVMAAAAWARRRGGIQD